MNKSNATIDDLLAAAEGEQLQFKEAKNHFDFSNAVKICCALANCGGGKLVLGITDKRPRQVVGSNACPQPERTRRGLRDKLRVDVEFHILNAPGGEQVIVFDVASRPVGLPVQVDGIAWWYETDSLVPMPESVRCGIYAESGLDFSAKICHGATLSDLDEKAISVFRRKWTERSRTKRIDSLSAEQLLRDCEAVTDDGITYAALILFGTKKAVQKFLPRSEVIFEYRSSEAAGPAAQREEFTEGFFAYNDRIWELVNLRNDKQHYQNGLAVLPIDTFNETVVREALLNAVSHRNYQLAGSVFVRQYRNRLVVESPGGFPPGITVEDVIDRQSPRNLLIAKIFQLCGLVERSGQGMNLMYELAVREAKALPDFKGTNSYFVKLTLNGQIIDKSILKMFHKIDEELLEKFTTQDYLLLSKFYNKNELADANPEQLAHLAELGIVEGTSLSETYRPSIGVQSVAATAIDIPRDAVQDKRHKALLAYCATPKTREEMQEFMGIANRSHFIKEFLTPLLKSGQLRMTLPDRPQSRRQQYVKA